MSIQAMTHVWRESRQKGSALLLLLAIGDHANDHGANAYPSIRTLAAKIRMSERRTRDLVGLLERSGELQVDRNGGPGGSNLYRVVGLGGGDGPGAKTAPVKRRSSEGGSRAPLQPASPEPSQEPSPGSSVEPGDGLAETCSRAEISSVDPTRPPTEREIERLHRRFLIEAKKTWDDVAARRKNPYRDPAALRTVGYQVTAARAEGADENTILAAIRQHMDHKSSPRRIPEWAREERTRREDLARADAALSRRAEERRAIATLEESGIRLQGTLKRLPGAATADHFTTNTQDRRAV